MHCLGLDSKHRAKGEFPTCSFRWGCWKGSLWVPWPCQQWHMNPVRAAQGQSSQMPPFQLTLNGETERELSWKGTFLVLLEWPHCLEGWEKFTGTTRNTNQAGWGKLKGTGAALALTLREQTQSCPRKGLSKSHQSTFAPAVGERRVEEQPKANPLPSLPEQGRQSYPRTEHRAHPGVTGTLLTAH